MRASARTLRMTRRERVVAAYVTGPAGHFVAGSIDLSLAIARILVARLARSARHRSLPS